MQARLIYANLTTLELRDTRDGGALNFPTIPAGDALSLSLRLVENLDGNTVLATRTLHALKASLGRVDMRPESGAVMLQIGEGDPVPNVNVTTAISCSATADQIANAINALTADVLTAKKPCTVVADSGSYLIRFADKSRVSITCIENSLWPVSFVELNSAQRDGGFTHELRFTQTPIAATVQFANLVPDPPVMSRVRVGSDNNGIKINEVQKLALPPSFSGAFCLTRGLTPTKTIGLPTSGQEIQTVLHVIADEGGNFSVTEEQDAVLIEFQASMGGSSQELLGVQVFDAPAGDPTFTLDTNTAEMWALMRRVNAQGEMPLMLNVDLFLNDEQNADIQRRRSFQLPVTFVMPVNRESANVAAALVWNQPPSRTRYAPFSPNNLLITTHAYPQLAGDGTGTQFVINHNLGSEYLSADVREAAGNGRQLVNGTDYSIRFNNANSATITFPRPIATDSVLVVIRTSDLASTWAPGVTWEIADINGLGDRLANIGRRVQTLESAVAINVASSDATKEDHPITAQWTLPKIAEVYPLRIKLDKLDTLDDLDLSKLGRAGGLFAAVHAANVEALPLTVPNAATSFVGRVFENRSGGTVPLNGALKHRGVNLRAGEFAACDGRAWYRVNRYNTEKSFYPTDFDRELFVIAVNDRQLRQRKALTVQFAIQTAVIGSNTNAQWMLVIEHGAFSSDLDPATTGVNLKDVEWNTVPVLNQRIILTSDPVIHTFGCRITRTIQVVNGQAQDTLTTTRILYGGEEGASGPVAANFALRARLVRFDTEDSQADARGFIGLIGLAPSGGSSSDGGDLGKAIIK